MASGVAPHGVQFVSEKPPNPDLTNSQSDTSNRPRSVPGNRRRVPPLSRDSGISSIELIQSPDIRDTWELNSREPEAPDDITTDRQEYSEDELLDITFDACSTTSRGEVSSSAIMDYLQTMTSQSPNQDRLSALQCLLDPNGRNPPVSRDTFHSTMREWIAQCAQDGNYGDENCVSMTEASREAKKATDISSPEHTTAFPEGEPCYCNTRELLSTVAELQHAHCRLNKQNGSLLRTVSQCEDTNLQLSIEVTELRAKLSSAQRAAVRARSLGDNLEEAKRSSREAQERASQAHSSCTILTNEMECLKVHIRMLEDKNEEITLERTCAEESVNKLRKVNAEMRAELEESFAMMALQDREITKRDFLMEKMKNSHLDNHRIIKGLQSELIRLQEYSQQIIISFERHFPSSQRLLISRRGAPPNYHSLQTEIQDMQQLRAAAEEVSSPVCEGPFLHWQQEDIQHIIQRIKSAELGHLHYTSYSERDSVSGYGSEPSEGPLPNSQQQQACIKKQLVNMLRELELQRALGEEREAKVEEPPRRAHRHTQTPDWSPILAHTPAPEARKVALVNWWKALRTDGGESKHKAINESPQSSLALAETKAKLQQAEQAIAEMRGQVCHLEAALKTAWEDVTVGHTSRPSKVGVSQTDQETNTVTEGTHWAGQEVATEPRDEAVVAQPLVDLDGVASEQRGQAQDRVTADGLLSSLRRMEAMVGGALENAELVRQGERRVSQVKDRMEAIAKTMEEALKRTADTNSQLSVLEAQIMEQPFTQLPGLLAPADQGSEVASAPARPDVEVQHTDRPRNPSPPTETSVPTPPWPHTNGDICLASREDSSHSSWSFNNPETLLTGEDQRNPLYSSPVVPNPWKTDGAAAPEAASLASVSENTYTSPVLTPSLIQPPPCASLLTVPPETRSKSAGDHRTAGNPEENVAGSQNPISLDCCPSEPAYHGIGQDSALSDFVSGQNTEEVGAKHHSEPKGCEQGYPLNEKGSSECHQGTQSETCGRSQTSEHSRGVFAERNQEGSGQSLQSLACWGTDSSDERSTGHSSVSQDLFVFPCTRSRPGQPPSMPTLPEEEEDSPEELDSSSSSPSTYTPGEAKAVAMTTPTIVFPKQATVIHQDGRPLEQARPHSPRARSARTLASSAAPITTVDGTGNVIDLLKDKLPELHLSAEERQKNLELLEEAKKVSDRFLTRRGRRSTCSLSDSPTGLSPIPTPSSSPVPSRSSSITVAPLIAEVSYVTAQSVSQHLEVPSVREQQEDPTPGQEGLRRLADWKPNEKRKVSSGTLAPRHSGPPPSKEHGGGGQKENCDPRGPRKAEEAGAAPGRGPNQAPATGVAKPVPRPPTQQAPCTAEIKTIGAFPPLMRAVSWDTVGTLNARNSPPNFSPPAEEVFSFPDPPCDGPLKSSGYKDFPAQPVNVQKLSKLREEHKLMRNQSLGSSKLGDLSETAEQDRGPALHSPIDEEMKEKMDSMPNISDVMLRKLKLHRGLPGCAPPLTEKEVENAFVQLSLAFRNDNYTLETRLKQSERERNLVEENTEKELEEFKGSLKSTAPQWQNMEQREAYQSLIETVAVLHRLATRLSSKAEVVGAVRQEKRMSKATEVMMQYVENLKRTYEKDHAELMEFKKLANQNSNRCYGGSIDTGDDGVPRPSRSMSLTLGKALPRRRVSVAVVPKFNLLNIPGQTPAIAGPGPGQSPPTGANHGPGPAGGPAPGSGLPVLCEAVVLKSNGSEAAHPAGTESGKSGPSEQERDPSTSAAKPPVVNLEEMRAQISAELKAKIEEECYSKGFEEGLKKKKELQELKEEEEKAEDRLLESEREDEESGKQIQPSSKVKEVLMVLDRLCPKILRRHRLLWVVPAMLLALFLLLNIFTHLGSYDNDPHGDMSADKSTVQGKKKLFGMNVVQPKNPTPE